MSHFLVGVILPVGTPAEDAEFHIERVLAPYDENIEVAPYDRPCYCIGREAERFGRTVMKEAGLGFDKIREAYWAVLKASGLSEEQLVWKDWIASYVEAEEAITASHKLFNKLDGDCEDCGGTGTRKSTYNPDSKWDWYSLGGRWNGVIAGKPRNDDKGGFNFDEEFRQLQENIAKVSEADLDIYAFVTPDGEWLEKGEMGWFGMASNELSEKDWKHTKNKLKAKYPDNYIVGVDCHI